MLSGLLPHVAKLRYLANAHSPAILTGIGVGGTIATAYLTGRATVKAVDIIEREKAVINTAVEENQDPVYLTKKDKAKLTWKVYIPPVSAGVITIGCIIMAHRISAKRMATVLVASGIAERALTEYKEKVIEKFGERKSEEVRAEIAQKRVLDTPLPTKEIILAGTGEVLCFDVTSGRYFSSTIEEIRRAENKVGYEVLHFMSASLSKFYEEVGLPPTPFSDTVGWNMNNHMEVEISSVISPDNRPCVAVDFRKPPISGYDNVWT